MLELAPTKSLFKTRFHKRLGFFSPEFFFYLQRSFQFESSSRIFAVEKASFFSSCLLRLLYSI
jgi:hypothetical protein